MNSFNQERVRYLLGQIQQSKATPAELQELLDLMEAHPDSSIINSIRIYFEDQNTAVPAATAADPVWQRMLHDILAIDVPAVEEHSTVPRAVHRIHFLKTAWFRYAAAAIVLIGITIAIIVSSQRQSARPGTDVTEVIAPADIDPGGNKAILTLADGTNILLDSAADGSLAQQGDTRIIKLTSGQLAYRYGKTARHPDAGNLLYNTVRTPRGGQYQVVLPDGSKVWLNAASSIRFPAAFAGNSREVEITGEVYMEVVRNSRQPFVVNADKMRIEVLGTRFNINAYQDEASVRTTLVEGRVRVSRLIGSEHSKESFIMKPGEQLAIDDSGFTIQDQADLDQALAWKEGDFVFRNTELKAILRQFARWYDIEIVYKGDIPEQYLTGAISRSRTLSEVLEMLKQNNVHFTRENRTLTIIQ